jgi:hypothetical protein
MGPAALTPFRDVAEVEALVFAFGSGALPRAAWDHRAHLTVGLWYLIEHGLERGGERIRLKPPFLQSSRRSNIVVARSWRGT